MPEDQKIKTYYKPKSKAYRQAVPEHQQGARDLRAQKRKEQMKNPTQYSTPIGPNSPSASQKIGQFLNRGVSNFKANVGRPILRGGTPPERKYPQQRQQRDFVPAPFVNIGMPMGGLDLSSHPDPMVSGMYRREPAERVEKKKKGGTEIHYHYHY